MNKKDIKELDNILQTYLTDDYYEEIRNNLIPYIIEWHENKVKKLNLHNVSKCEGNVRKATLIAYVIKNINESSDEEIDKMYQQLDEILK